MASHLHLPLFGRRARVRAGAQLPAVPGPERGPVVVGVGVQSAGRRETRLRSVQRRAQGCQRRRIAETEVVSNGWCADTLTTSPVAASKTKRPASVRMVPPSGSQTREISPLM